MTNSTDIAEIQDKIDYALKKLNSGDITHVKDPIKIEDSIDFAAARAIVQKHEEWCKSMKYDQEGNSGSYEAEQRK